MFWYGWRYEDQSSTLEPNLSSYDQNCRIVRMLVVSLMGLWINKYISKAVDSGITGLIYMV